MAINKNFVIKNGIEVSENLIYGNDLTRKVGINSAIPDYALDVNGDIGLTGGISAGGTTGQTNQYLRSTGNGISWGSFPTLRDTETYTAGVGQSIFPNSGLFPHTPDFIDVYVDGVKLANNEFVSIDGNTKVQIVIPCFGNETVELVAYNTVSTGTGNTGINGISVLEDGVLTGNAGSINAINFVGASVTAIGSGAGVTVYISGTGGGGTGESFWTSNGSGINTSSNVGIKTTLPRFPLEINSVGSSGTSLWVNGDARITGILTIGTASISLDGSTNTIRVGSGVTINSSSITVTDLIVTNSITGSGITVSNVTISDTAPLSPNPGNLWYSSLIGRGFIYYNDGDSSQWVDFSPSGAGATATTSSAVSSQWVTTTAGIHTLSNVGIGTTNPLSKLHVSGDALVSGVVTATTFIGNLTGTATTATVAQGLTGSPNVTLGNVVVTGISTFNGKVRVNNSNILLGDGSENFGSQIKLGNGNSTDAFGDSSDLWIYHNPSYGNLLQDITGTGVRIWTPDFQLKSSDNTKSMILALQNAGVELYYNNVKKFETLGAGVTVTGTTFTNNLSVSGVLTASQINGTIIGSIENATNLTGGTANASSLNVSGITTISQGRIQADASSNLRFGNLPAGSGSGRNIAIGDQVLVSLSGGSGRNIGIGELSYYDTTTGQYNIGIGERAGQKVSTGSYNVILGAYDGNSGNLDIRTSSNNVVIADGQGNIRQYINSSGNVGIKTTTATEALTVAGVVSATSFHGTLNASQLTGALPAIDGSALINVTGSGSGVVIQEDGTPVGTAGTINFGNNVSVSFASGIATVSGASSVSAATTAYALAGSPNLNVGVVTATTLNITNDYLVLPRGTSKGIHFGVPPYDNGANDSVIFVSDSVTNSGELVLNSGDYSTKIIGKSLIFRSNFADQCSIGTETSYILSRVGIGSTQPTSKLDVSGDAKVSGVVTASSFSGSGSGLTNLPSGQLTGALPALDGSALINLPAQPGDGVNVRDDNTPVGSARTVNFGTGLDVTISGGIATITASGGSLQSRTVVTGVTTSIANNGIGNTNITGFKSYALMKVGLSTAGWLRLYTDSASRSADSSRSIGVDPAPGSGVIAEVVTTGISTTQIISPFVMGGNLDNPADTTIYAAITNLSGSTQAITANLTILQLEA